MRHTTTAAATAAVLLLGLAVAGCGSTDSSSDGKTSGTPAADRPSPNASAQREAAYLIAIHDIPFTSHRPTTTELTAYPPKWCAGLADGHSAEWLFSAGGGALYPSGMDWGTVKKNANQLLVAGVRSYCPEHLDTVTAELRASGEY